ITKWKRLLNAFGEYQNRRQFGNHVVVFINRVMKPVQYTENPNKFLERRDRLNTVLAFSGMYVDTDGKVKRSQRAANLNEAMERASRLHAALSSRAVHRDVLEYCRAELLQENYFHAVFEATKSIAAKVRQLSGLVNDGAQLIQAALAGASPLLAINDLRTDSDRSEQSGFVNLLVGVFGTVRNPLAHNPKVEWAMDEQDALDTLTLVSMIHRKLDRARRLSGLRTSRSKTSFRR